MPKSNRLLRSTLLDKKPFCKNEGINPATLLKWVYRLFKHFLGVAEQIGIIRQSNGKYLLGDKDSSGLLLVVADSDYAFCSYNMIYGNAVNYTKIAGALGIENINDYGTVVAPGASMFYAIRFER